MEQASMTALVSAFARAYHAKIEGVKVFDDSMAEALFTKEEYRQIADTMAAGIGFFHPGFLGDRREALRWIVDHQLSPSPLGRSAFAEEALGTAARMGAGQYLILAAGYDTFAYRQPEWAGRLTVFELDHPDTAADKRERLHRAGVALPSNVRFVPADFTAEDWQAALPREDGFSPETVSFCSLLGFCYYLEKEQLAKMLFALAGILSPGSTLVFDYPDRDHDFGGAGRRQAMLAQEAGEAMCAGYSYREMERLLSDSGFLIYEHLRPREITGRYFAPYNVRHPGHPLAAFPGVNYCLAVRQPF